MKTSEIQKLQKSPVLSNLSENELLEILESASYCEFASGDILLKEGERQDFMLLITHGKVDVCRGELHIATRTGAQVLGEMCLVDPGVRSASVFARSAVRLYKLPRQALWNQLSQGNSAAIRLMLNLTVLMCQRLEEINQMVQNEVVVSRESSGVFSRLFSMLFGKGKR